jgi:hypothetical protein
LHHLARSRSLHAVNTFKDSIHFRNAIRSIVSLRIPHDDNHLSRHEAIRQMHWISYQRATAIYLYQSDVWFVGTRYIQWR